MSQDARQWIALPPARLCRSEGVVVETRWTVAWQSSNVPPRAMLWMFGSVYGTLFFFPLNISLLWYWYKRTGYLEDQMAALADDKKAQLREWFASARRRSLPGVPQCPSVSPPQTCSPGPRRRAAARSTLRGRRPVRQVIPWKSQVPSASPPTGSSRTGPTVVLADVGVLPEIPRQAAKADAASRAADDRRRYCRRPVECGPGLDFHVAAASA